MPYDGFDINTKTWSTSSTTTATGKSESDNLVNDLLKTLGNFVNEMSPVFFLESMQNLKTAVEEFGQGMSATLACVSVDLQVVSSGLSSAALAYASTDKAIASTFAQLDTQLGYYTSTAISGTPLATPSAANVAALNIAYQQYSKGPGVSSGINLSNIHPANTAPAIPLVVLIIIGIVLLPVGA